MPEKSGMDAGLWAAPLVGVAVCPEAGAAANAVVTKNVASKRAFPQCKFMPTSRLVCPVSSGCEHCWQSISRTGTAHDLMKPHEWLGDGQRNYAMIRIRDERNLSKGGCDDEDQSPHSVGRRRNARGCGFR